MEGMVLQMVSSIIAYILTFLIVIAFGFTVYYFLRQVGVVKLKTGGWKLQSVNNEPAGLVDELAAGTVMKTGSPNDDVKLIGGVSAMVIGSRLLLYIIACLGVMLFINQSESLLNSFPLRWNRADSPFYINIARNWYTGQGDNRSLIVFYPLYPILIRIMNSLIRDYFVAGVLISTLSLITAGVYLYKLIQLDFDNRIALDSIKFLLIFPFSFILGLVFPDSLFLALTVMTFYYLRRKKWLLTGILGGLACLTQNYGILLLIPVGIEYLAVTRFIQMIREGNWRQIWSDLLKNGLFLWLIPLGQFGYLLLNKLVTGNWFTFLTYLNGSGEHNMNLNIVANLTEYFTAAFTCKPNIVVYTLIPVIILAFFIVSIVFYALRKLRISYIFYILIYLFIYFTSVQLADGPRFLMGLFPVYIVLALLARNRVNDFILTVLSGLALCYYMIMFISGFPIF